MWLQRERKDDVIWSDLKLGGHLELNAILFQSWSKLRSRSRLTSFLGSNILRSSSHTTLWFLQVKHQYLKTRDSNPPDLIGSLPIWCLASRSPDFYQILPIYHKILKTRGKLLICRIFGDLSLWNTHIILTFFAKSIMVCYNSGRNDVKIQEMALERT